MLINISNVEDIFYDKNIENVLPELYKKWTILVRSGRNSKSIFFDLNQEHLDRLSEYYGTPVIVEKLGNIVKNCITTIDKLVDHLEWNISISREGEHIYLSCWR